MSRSRIHVPAPDEHDYHADRHEERRRLALKSLDVSDVLAEVDDLIAQEPDPSKHPCAAMAAWLLNRRLEPGHGGDFWDAWKRLACQAIDRLVEAKLADPTCWED